MPTQPQRSSKKLFGVVVLNAVITLSEFIGGIMSGVCLLFQMLSITLVIHWQLFFLTGHKKWPEKKQIKNVRMATSV